MNSPRKLRRGSHPSSRRAGSLRRLNSAPSLEELGETSKPTTTRRRSSLQRTVAASAITSAEEEKNSSDERLSEEPAVLVYAEPVKIVSKDEIKSSKKVKTKRRKHPKNQHAEEEQEEKTTASPVSAVNHQTVTTSSAIPIINPTTTTPNNNNRPKYPRSLLGMVVRIVKILHAMLNIIVIRGSVLTRRNLNTKLDEYLLMATTTTTTVDTQDVVALYQEHISHHLFVFYLSWGRLMVCLIVLMWGTCTSRLPKPIAIYIGMAMHWVDSIRALDSNHWLPSTSSSSDSDSTGDYEPDPNRSLTAEEEVQTAMAWLHLCWFLVDGFYCRQILQKRKQEELRIQHELYLELIGEEEELADNDYRNKKKRN